MARVRAALLAAGRGVRIGGDLPKSLLAVGEHESLLHYCLRGLKAAGIDDLLVVTGFGAAAMQERVTEQWGEEGVTFVFNARWASWGNFHSVRVALDQSPSSDVMVVNSDIVVHPGVYERVVATEGDLVLAVQRRRVLNEEDMKVELQGSRVLDIGKQLPRGRSHGEYAGVSLLRRRAADVYSRMSTDLEWDARTAGYYEDVYAAMLPYVDMRAADVGEMEYAEVDFHEDFDNAAAVIEKNLQAWSSGSMSTADV